jgi:hypothetical protein
MHRLFHLVVLLRDIENLGFDPRPNVFPGEGMVRSGVTGEAGKECPGEDGCKKVLHGFFNRFEADARIGLIKKLGLHIAKRPADCFDLLAVTLGVP